MDTTTPGGRLVFHVFAALAEFIREPIASGTREGLDTATRPRPCRRPTRRRHPRDHPRRQRPAPPSPRARSPRSSSFNSPGGGMAASSAARRPLTRGLGFAVTDGWGLRPRSCGGRAGPGE
ncbi:recombinase family protein [Streptomyces lavendulae]|uniref:recombinase family protein n=1 Tax=Streptomyces lavendulae TaxID=1914 RepID=UPI0036EB332A